MADPLLNPTGEKGIGGVLKKSERKSAFDPKKPGMFPGDYKILKLHQTMVNLKMLINLKLSF